MATNEQANGKDPGPAGQSRSPLVLALLVLMLINVGATGWMLYSRRTGTIHPEATAASVEAPPPSDPSPAPEQPMPFVLDPFLVNLADLSGKRYLRATLEFEVSSPQGAEEMKTKTSQIRDRIILVLTSKNFDDIRTATDKGVLREEILNELNQILISGKARHIYFKEFVVQ
jgi:flagellar protein FliL